MPWCHVRNLVRHCQRILPSQSGWRPPNLPRSSTQNTSTFSTHPTPSIPSDDSGSSLPSIESGSVYSQRTQNSLKSTFEDCQNKHNERQSETSQSSVRAKQVRVRRTRKKKAGKSPPPTLKRTATTKAGANSPVESKNVAGEKKGQEHDHRSDRVKKPAAPSNAPGKRRSGKLTVRRTPGRGSFRKLLSVRNVNSQASAKRGSAPRIVVRRFTSPIRIRRQSSGSIVTYARVAPRKSGASTDATGPKSADLKTSARITAFKAAREKHYLLRKRKAGGEKRQGRRPGSAGIEKRLSLNRGKTLRGQTGKEQKVTVESAVQKTNASQLELTPIPVPTPPVPSLAYGLDRVLFNPGVHLLQDPRSRVYNFDPYLQNIMPLNEFDFDALKKYITSSEDTTLRDVAQQHAKRYVGSTSSMTGVLAHFHYLLSQWRPLNMSMLSRGFPVTSQKFTELLRSPGVIYLRYQDGTYAIDADKEFDSGNVLMLLGKSMEKLLSLKTADFEKYRRSNPEKISEEERAAPESYHYSTSGDFLMRSQLDTFDPRLPGTGMFDLKTRAVVSIRMDVSNHEEGIGYEIKDRMGAWESYEREYYDMIRAAFLKYSLQVRMGRMEGIFVAHHNIERIFGFQYVGLDEMDLALHDQKDNVLGDREFLLSVNLLNKVLDRAIEKFPRTSIRLHFETREAVTPFMYIFAEPVTEEQVEKTQSQHRATMDAFERQALGMATSDPTDQPTSAAQWKDMEASIQDIMDRDEKGIEEEDPSISQEPQEKREDALLPEESDSVNGSSKFQNDPLAQDTTVQKSEPEPTLPSDLESDDHFDTNADQPFLETIKQDNSNMAGEVLAMTLIIRNKVNNKYVDRPTSLHPGDIWEVEHSLVERTDAYKARGLYEACKARRKKKMTSRTEGDLTKVNKYLLNLRRMSKEGRRWRQSVDQRDEAKPVHVLGQN